MITGQRPQSTARGSHRQLQAARRDADGSEGDSARRTDVGVSRPSDHPGAAADPRLPRGEPESSTVAATTRSASASSSSSRRSSTTRSTWSAAWTSRFGRAPRRTRTRTRSPRARFSVPSEGGRGEPKRDGEESADQQAGEPQKVKARAYTRCNRCGRPRAVSGSSSSAGSACGSWPEGRDPGRGEGRSWRN